MARDCPHLRRSWLYHCRTNGHTTKYCPKLISKWEDRACQRGTNLISSEIKRVIKGEFPNLNIVTRGGEKTGADADTLPQIHKASYKEDMYDPLKQKLFFKYAIEVFQNIPSPKMKKKPPQTMVYPNVITEISSSHGDKNSALSNSNEVIHGQ
jgi:hypothetical protein